MRSARDQLRAVPLVPAFFILPLSLDFKSNEVGGSVWQYLLVGLTFFGFALYVVSRRMPRPRGMFWGACSLCMFIVLGGSVLSFLVNRPPADQYARVILPFVLFWAAYLVSVSMCNRGRYEMLSRLITIGCAVSTAFSVPAGFLLSGADTSDVRYQILSPVLIFFEAILLHNIFVTGRRKRMSQLLLAACVGLQLISVTRSALLALFIVFAATLWLTTPRLGGFIRRAIRMVIPALFVGFVAYQATTLVAPEVAGRWEVRTSTIERSGADATTLSRLAEMKEQLDRWSSSVTSMLVGQSYGANYTWSKDFWDAMLATQEWRLETVDRERFEFGHSFWTSSLFSGGVLFGTALPLLLLYATYTGTAHARHLLRQRRDPWSFEVQAKATLFLVATLASTIGSNPFALRYSALVGGLALGILVVTRRMQQEQDRATDLMHRSAAGHFPAQPMLR